MSQHTPAISRTVWFRSGVAGMASYLDAAAIVSTGTALVLYQGPLGLDKSTIGIMSSMLTLSIAAGALVGGRLGDKFGRRSVFTATMVLLVAGAALLALAPSASFLYAGILMVGFAAGADLPVSLALIAEESPAGARGKLVAFSQVFWYLGMIATQFIGIFAGGLGATGARILYGHIVIVGLLVLILRIRVPESRQWLAEQNAAEAQPQTGFNFSMVRELFRKPFLTSFAALAIFYCLTNVAANTKGQFSTYMYVNVAGSNVQVASTISLCLLFVSISAALLFMRIVDGPHRMKWYTLGGLLFTLQFVIPAVLGVSVWTLAVGYALGGIGMALAFEGIFKVWTQESFPTLLRSTAQGAMLAIARVVAAMVALWTPALLAAGPRVLFASLASFVAVATVIGFWINRMPKVQPSTSTPTPAVLDAH